MDYYLRRVGLTYALLDDQSQPDGAWPHGWKSLRLFSPADASSLPGWLMLRPVTEGFPACVAVIDYLTQYEQRYALLVRRPVRVAAVRWSGAGFAMHTGGARYGPGHSVRHRHLEQPSRTDVSGSSRLRRSATALGPLPRRRALCWPAGAASRGVFTCSSTRS